MKKWENNLYRDSVVVVGPVEMWRKPRPAEKAEDAAGAGGQTPGMGERRAASFHTTYGGQLWRLWISGRAKWPATTQTKGMDVFIFAPLYIGVVGFHLRGMSR